MTLIGQWFRAARHVAAGLVLFGAGSLREVMTGLAADYQAAHGTTVRTEFGPSGLMRERIDGQKILAAHGFIPVALPAS